MVTKPPDKAARCGLRAQPMEGGRVTGNAISHHSAFESSLPASVWSSGVLATLLSDQREQLEGKIQERYGLAKDKARESVEEWRLRQNV